VDLLRAGQILLVFPEGYPNVDPSYTPKTGDDAFLPFQPGFLRIAALAEQDGVTRVPIVPVGLAYQRGERWRVTVRFGRPITLSPGVSLRDQVATIEEQVRNLSSSRHRCSSACRGPGRCGSRVTGIHLGRVEKA
jgi:1-acyl-sn-glycerol-3-phosphate acyltransferase